MRQTRVLLNAQGATYGESATSRYVRALVRHLPYAPVGQSLTYFDYRFKQKPYMCSQSWERATPPRLNPWLMPPRAGDYLFGRLPWLKVGALASGFDVLHLPDDSVIRARSRRSMATLHMAPPLQRPEFFDPDYCEWVRNWVRRMRDTCDLLVTVSEHLRQLVIADFSFPPDRVVAIPLGIEDDFKPAAQPADGEPPTILYVGRIRPAKNVMAVCKVFQLLLERHPNLQLQLVGKADVSNDTILSWLGNDKLA